VERSGKFSAALLSEKAILSLIYFQARILRLKVGEDYGYVSVCLLSLRLFL
jgi:hypothetical protein